ncbi:MAG: NADPH-dependent oxidoreductase [Actinobacteria bacterium]|nr:MAG: NADPH-dependent oxidoreductase [Actinomycetota bacterium]
MTTDTSDPTPVSNETIRTQLAHRTIRAFTDEPVSEDIITTLLEVARHSATTAFQQQFTIIRITDPDLRAEIGAVSTQPHVKSTAGELFIFVLDLHRNAQIREQAGADLAPLSRMNAYVHAHDDTLIAAQNMVVAAESLGLGTVYLGSINADPRRMIRALGLPKYTYPIVGLIVGHAAQTPQCKPRLPLSVTTGVNAYPELVDPAAQLEDYDREVQEYYGTRDTNTRVDSFTHIIANNLGKGVAEQSPMLEVMHEQGLALQ